MRPPPGLLLSLESEAAAVGALGKGNSHLGDGSISAIPGNKCCICSRDTHLFCRKMLNPSAQSHAEEEECAEKNGDKLMRSLK